MRGVRGYEVAQREERIARLRRYLWLRAMVAAGSSQVVIARALGVSQSAVSQQLKSAGELDGVGPETLLEAATPIIKEMARERGYDDLAVFGSVARGAAHTGSDIDLLVRPPITATSFDFVEFKQDLETVLGRQIDLVSWDGLKPHIDDDIRREAVLL